MMNFALLAAGEIEAPVNWIYIGLGILGVLALIFVVAVFIPWLQDFRHELKYLNSEIQRTEGREQRHWIKKKKRLMRSILPFFHYDHH